MPMKRITTLLAAAAILAAVLAAPVAAHAQDQNRADIIIIAGAGSQEHPFRTDDGSIARDVRDVDFRKWTGSAEIGARIGGAIVTAGIERSHTFAPEEHETSGVIGGIAGAGVAAAFGRTHIGIQAIGGFGIPEFGERRGIGLGVVGIRNHFVAAARYWPSTERISASLGVAF